MNYPYIIAEIGSNWRSLEIAKKQIEAAKECGADAAKFQMFTNKELYGYDDGSKCWGLPRELVDPLALHCQSVGIDFMCTAFSIDGYDFIDPCVKMHKIASCEAYWKELVDYVDSLGKPFLRSHAFNQDIWKKAGEIPMLCVSRYPATHQDYSISSLGYWDCGGDWGVSDHTTDILIPTVSVGAGARVFEKHFDGMLTYGGQLFYKDLETTPDEPVSCGLIDFGSYVKIIRQAYDLLTRPSTNSDPDIETYAKRRYVPEYGGWYRTKKS